MGAIHHRRPANRKEPRLKGFEPINLRFRRPTQQNDKLVNNKNLQQAQTSAYKPAYKKNPKTGQNQAENLPEDLAEIVQLWPELPEHIKAAINSLINIYKLDSK